MTVSATSSQSGAPTAVNASEQDVAEPSIAPRDPRGNAKTIVVAERAAGAAEVGVTIATAFVTGTATTYIAAIAAESVVTAHLETASTTLVAGNRAAPTLIVAAPNMAPPRSRGHATTSYSRPEGVPVHPHEPRLAALYDKLNTKHFLGRLPMLPVLVGIPADADGRDDSNGLTRMRWFRWFHSGRKPGFAAIYLSDWLFEADWADEADRWWLIEETVLHEMVHVRVNFAAFKRGSKPEVGGHGPRFAAACNQIGRLMGWDDVRPDDECDEGAEDRASEWPPCMNYE